MQIEIEDVIIVQGHAEGVVNRPAQAVRRGYKRSSRATHHRPRPSAYSQHMLGSGHEAP